MQILMIRHGRTDWNEARRIQGRTDIPLNERGRAEQAGRRVPSAFSGAKIWISPLARARETATQMNMGEVSEDPRLIEMDFGEWEGRTHAELTAEDPNGMANLESMGLDMRPPGGETPAEVVARLFEFLSAVKGPRHIVVSHKGVMRAAFAAALDWDMREDLPFRVDWNAGQLFEWIDGQLRLQEANLPLGTS